MTGSRTRSRRINNDRQCMGKGAEVSIMTGSTRINNDRQYKDQQ